MKRKLIQMAGKTMVVSLPSAWVKKYNLKKGEEIDLQEEGNTVLVRTVKSVKPEGRPRIDISSTGSLLLRILAGLYKSGYDEFELVFDDPQVLKKVEKDLKEFLIGLEIVSQGKQSCIVKVLTQEVDTEFDNVLRKIFLSLISFSNESLECYKKNDFNALQEVLEYEKTNNKLTTFCRRILNKKGYTKTLKITYIYCLIEELEKLADEYKYICEYLIKKKKKSSKDILMIYQKTNSFFNDFYELFYKYDQNKIINLYNMKKELISEIDTQLDKKTECYSKILHHLANIVQLTGNCLTFKLCLEL